MRRAIGPLGCLLACVMFACMPNRLSFIFKGDIKPSSSCTYSTGGTDFLTSGTLDLFYTKSYVFAAEVQNKLSSKDGNTIYVSAVKWKLQVPSPISHFLSCGKILAALPGSETGYAECTTGVTATYQKYFSSGMTEPMAYAVAAGGSAALKVTLLGNEVSTYILDSLKVGATGVNPYFTTTDSVMTIFLEIEVIGMTLGGTEVSTGGFLFPIQLCKGCARRQPAGASCQNGTSDTGAALLDKPCNIGQDGVVDCRYACGQNGDCKDKETCQSGSCSCGSNSGCTNSNTCNGTQCNCYGGAACTGSQTCSSTTQTCVTSS